MGRVEREYERLLREAYGGRAAVRGSLVMRRPSSKQLVVTSRSFDGGESVVAEYDVAAANPKFDPRRYAEKSPEREEPREREDAPEPFEVEKLPDVREELAAAAAYDDEGAFVVEAREQEYVDGANGRPPPELGRSANRFTQRRIEELVKDSDVLSDIQSILKGEPMPPAPPPPRAEPPPPSKAKSEENGHSIFEEIAAKMRYAQAYDLGAVELGQRFDSFDSGSAAALPVEAQPRPDAVSRHFDRIESLPAEPAHASGSQSKG
jgi:hypothetical protein